MPVTKQKLIRHYALDRCLRNQTRRYYIEDLLAECNKALEAELEAQLLWFGDDVEVLQPETLRQQIAEKIAKMHDLYK